MNDFLITAIPFAESPYDYLLLLTVNDTGEVLKRFVSCKCYAVRESQYQQFQNLPPYCKRNQKLLHYMQIVQSVIYPRLE